MKFNISPKLHGIIFYTVLVVAAAGTLYMGLLMPMHHESKNNDSKHMNMPEHNGHN